MIIHKWNPLLSAEVIRIRVTVFFPVPTGSFLSPTSAQLLIIKFFFKFWWNASHSFYQTWIKNKNFSAANTLFPCKPIICLHWICVLIISWRVIKYLHKVEIQTLLSAMIPIKWDSCVVSEIRGRFSWGSKIWNEIRKKEEELVG